MKTAFARVIAGIAVVIALGAALAFFALPPLVEDACRRQLAALPAALAQDGRLALKQPEVAEVRFSFPARELVLRDFAMHGSVLDVPAPGVTGAAAGGVAAGSVAAGNVPAPVAGVLYTAGEIACTLTWRALLLATPLGRFILPGSGDGVMVPVADSLRLDEAALALAHREMSLNLHATAMRGANVAVDSALLRRLLDPAPDGQPGASGDILYPLAATSLTATAVDLSADFPGSDQSASLTMNSGGITGLDGRRAASAQVDSVACTLDGEPGLRVASLTLEDITLPDREQVLALARARASGDEAALLRAFEAALAGPEPLVRKAGLSGLELALDGALPDAGAGRTAVGAPALMLDTASLDWRSSTPPDHTLTVKGLSLPLALLEEESGLSFPGLNAFVLDASLSRSVEPGGESGKSAARHEGAIAARGLCGVDYAFRLTSGGQDFPQDMLRGTYSEASLTYTDQGFLAYLASGVMPTAQAAMMAIKVGLGRFCAKNTPENATLRDALETFAERPGTVNIRARAPFTPMQALFIAGDGDAGALFSATAAPGPESLEQAMNRVRAGRAPDAAASSQGSGPSAGGQR